MYRIIYASNAACEMSKAHLSQIVRSSRRNNARAQITGMLIFHENRFFQVLEGEQLAVKTTLARIVKDPRHRGTLVIEHGAVAQRAFPGWRMGYVDPARLDPDQRDRVFQIYNLIPPDSKERGAADAVRQQVRHFLAAFKSLQDNRPAASRLAPQRPAVPHSDPGQIDHLLMTPALLMTPVSMDRGQFAHSR